MMQGFPKGFRRKRAIFCRFGGLLKFFRASRVLSKVHLPYNFYSNLSCALKKQNTPDIQYTHRDVSAQQRRSANYAPCSTPLPDVCGLQRDS